MQYHWNYKTTRDYASLLFNTFSSDTITWYTTKKYHDADDIVHFTTHDEIHDSFDEAFLVAYVYPKEGYMFSITLPLKKWDKKYVIRVKYSNNAFWYFDGIRYIDLKLDITKSVQTYEFYYKIDELKSYDNNIIVFLTYTPREYDHYILKNTLLPTISNNELCVVAVSLDINITSSITRKKLFERIQYVLKRLRLK